MLQLNQVWFGFDEEFLFEDLSLVIHTGHRVGVIGRNGVGKTTVFNLIRHVHIPNEGEVVVPARWRIAWLRQDTPATDRTALAFVVDGNHELRLVEKQIQDAEARDDMNAYADLLDTYGALGGFQAEAQAGMILAGLGFSADDFHKPYSAFSGGWRIRLNLAQTLSQPSELMLLDEPTNHLDLEATVWLQKWISRYQGTMLCISHDREFLDKTVDEVLHLERKNGVLYQGGYSSFERQVAERLEYQEKVFDQQEKERKRIQVFIDRFRTYATKAKQVQSRLKMLEKMRATAPLRALSPYKFKIEAPGKMDRPMLSIDDAILGYCENVVLSNVTERIYPGDRIALLGLNGAGKSTFLKSLAGELDLLGGSRESGMHTTIGYFAQHQLELLDETICAYDHVIADGSVLTQQARNFLGYWGFHGDDIFRPVSSFSGGEKARLVLALITRHKPSLLVLDEPTNHLDLEMREALTSALNQYEGAVLMVAHDQQLLRECADEFWLVRGGAVTHFAGDLDDYEEIVERSVQIDSPKGRPSNRSRKDLRRARAIERESRRESDRRRNELEKAIHTLQKELNELSNMLADSDALSKIDNSDLQAIFAKYGRRRKRLEKMEEEWVALAGD
ncbi:MAG: ABC-F family ATP-binding cassette domain-containing protein [Gammaproteobacteria bacterium]|nr:ABC-F family ATP-binding cassette domain-containing protein [Gammaproteobacteria bacterium]